MSRDWKTKRFRQERIFQAPRKVVCEAAREVIAALLVGWQLEDAADGFTARAQSGPEAALARLRFRSALDGTRVIVEVRLQRESGLHRFTLYDVDAHHDNEIQRWFDNIDWRVREKQAVEHEEQSAKKHAGGKE